MSEPLMGISIQQPWIDLILRGAKSIEVRHWDAGWRGPVALHSPWRIDHAAACFFGYRAPWDLPRGRIVGVARLADVIEWDPEGWRRLVHRHRQVLPHSRGTFGLVLEDVRELDRPIRAKGRPRLIPLKPELARRVYRAAGVTTRETGGRRPPPR